MPKIIPKHPGGFKDKIDTRDYQWSEIGKSVSPFNWERGFDIETELGLKLPVKDQNGSLSCGGQAVATYMSVLDYTDDQTFEERSAKFIYAQAHAPGGGAWGRDLMAVVAKQGVCREIVCPSYDNGKPPTEAFMARPWEITPDMRMDAGNQKIMNYANVAPDIDLVAQAIMANRGGIMGLDGEDNGTWRSLFPKPAKKKVWGHWMYMGKAQIIKGVKYIGVLNSWGKETGDNGWQWISEEHFKKGLVWPSWTMLYKPKSQFVKTLEALLKKLNKV